MAYRQTLRGESFVFADLRDLMAKANEAKSGDELAGIAATSETERVAAKLALADVPLREFLAQPLVEDEVTAALTRAHDAPAFAEIATLTVGEFRELILSGSFPARWRALSRAILPEMAAAVAKIMGNLDLAAAAAPLRTVVRCRNTLGEACVFAARIQPNHPTDDPRGILMSTLDGLLLGCGDAVIGVNPATDSIANTEAISRALADLIDRIGAPTQACVLAHVTTQLRALERGAPIDLVFQSVAGTEAANTSFGIDLAMLAEARAAVLASHRAGSRSYIGENVTYFETGQGSALSADAAHGVDQLTLEARAQGVARLFEPFLVNSVVGFIGPEYLADARQIARAGLEDHFVGRLLGLPMGVDVCYTNHADADQNSNDSLLLQLAAAGCAFVMAVPAGDDVMLSYQTTSPNDVATVRRLLGLKPTPEFAAWLERIGMTQDGVLSGADRIAPGASGLAALRAAAPQLVDRSLERSGL